ncbi:MAG: TspO/MBR family protein [Methanomicrobiales archaeon]
MTVRNLIKKVLYFVLAIGICLLAGYVGSAYSTPSIPTWYAGLQKSELTPPSWAFAPVWTALYILMGFSLYLILQSGITKGEVFVGLLLFLLQLGLNISWSYLFFGWHMIFFAFLCIVALWTFLLCTILQVFRFSIISAALLVPCLIWISFAAYLNYVIMVLNP